MALEAGLAIVAVLDASFDGSDGIVVLQLDTTAEHPLADVNAADPAKWTARFESVAYVGYNLRLLSFDALEVSLSATVPNAGPDVINYGNAPSDISDTLGRTLAAVSVPL